MESIGSLIDLIYPGLPMAGTLAAGILALYALRRFLNQRYRGQADKGMKVQITMLVVSLIFLVIVIVVAPIDDNRRGQILGLFGIILSAAIALSSTTLLGNAVAGLMLRAVRSFRIGDFVEIGNSFGRVSELGLFHTEIQTRESDLTTLPNLHLANNPVKVIRSSGTILWSEVSLGYDIPRLRIKEVLLRAATKSELQDPFVHVMHLGDFSVTYRVAGMLLDVKQLLSARSRLRENVLDELHRAHIEIVSPNFMNTRQIESHEKFIPRVDREGDSNQGESLPEDIVFDKAEEAVTLEQLKQKVQTIGSEIENLEKSLSNTKSDEAKAEIQSRINRLVKTREILKARLESAQDE